ncbi:carph-isopro domain-containing protein [Cereibacter sphaeroides]|uniref:carph-isopro domain-containing protein n=1 Tax=Cereibacter sphaeroides TaxID=1063 RepID=UPI003FCE128F
MARACGRPVSTVQSWKDRGSIPDEHKRPVLNAALANGIALTPAQFFPTEQKGAA